VPVGAEFHDFSENVVSGLLAESRSPVYTEHSLVVSAFIGDELLQSDTCLGRGKRAFESCSSQTHVLVAVNLKMTLNFLSVAEP